MSRQPAVQLAEALHKWNDAVTNAIQHLEKRPKEAHDFTGIETFKEPQKRKLRGKEVNITNFDAAKKKQLQDDLKAKLEEQQECGKLRARLRCWLYKLEIEKRTKKAKEDQFHSSRIVFGKCRLKCCNLTNNTVHQNNGDGDDCNNGCCTNILVVALEKILACIGDAAEAARRLKNSDDKEDYKNILPLALKTSMSLISHAVKLVFPPGEAICAGICLLISMVQKVSQQYDSVEEISRKIDAYLDWLSSYVEIADAMPNSSQRVVDANAKILALSIQLLYLNCKHIHRSRCNVFFRFGQDARLLKAEREFNDAVEKKKTLRSTENHVMLRRISLMQPE